MAASAARQRKTAAQRREQRRRAEARLILHLLGAVISLGTHRGCHGSRLGCIMERILNESKQEDTKKEHGSARQHTDEQENVASNEGEKAKGGEDGDKGQDVPKAEEPHGALAQKEEQEEEDAREEEQTQLERPAKRKRELDLSKDLDFEDVHGEDLDLPEHDLPEALQTIPEEEELQECRKEVLEEANVLPEQDSHTPPDIDFEARQKEDQSEQKDEPEDAQETGTAEDKNDQSEQPDEHVWAQETTTVEEDLDAEFRPFSDEQLRSALANWPLMLKELRTTPLQYRKPDHSEQEDKTKRVLQAIIKEHRRRGL